MDSYLDIAEAVLRAARRPLTPKAIMAAAFRSGIVPHHLFGKNQHKTLQARLSEDILQYNLESRFFRTDPGLFFLSELRSDPSISDEFKNPFHARRRTRDLCKASALAFEMTYILQIKNSRVKSWKELLRDADRAQALKYIDSRTSPDDALLVWAFSIVRRENELLTYKVGRYRDNRDAFTNRRSIGFAEMVGFEDASLFSDDMGVTECGLSAVMSDLDLSRSAFGANKAIIRPTVSFALIAKDRLPHPVVLFVMEWQCPSWFEPTARRLSLNEVRWTDATRPPNDIDAFEPWSAAAFTALVELSGAGHLYGKKNKGATRGVSAF